MKIGYQFIGGNLPCVFIIARAAEIEDGDGFLDPLVDKVFGFEYLLKKVRVVWIYPFHFLEPNQCIAPQLALTVFLRPFHELCRDLADETPVCSITREGRGVGFNKFGLSDGGIQLSLIGKLYGLIEVNASDLLLQGIQFVCEGLVIRSIYQCLLIHGNGLFPALSTLSLFGSGNIIVCVIFRQRILVELFRIVVIGIYINDGLECLGSHLPIFLFAQCDTLLVEKFGAFLLYPGQSCTCILVAGKNLVDLL